MDLYFVHVSPHKAGSPTGCPQATEFWFLLNDLGAHSDLVEKNKTKEDNAAYKVEIIAKKTP